jgi:hypothetical protein
MRFHYPALICSLFFLFLVLISCDTNRRGLINTGPSTPTIEYVEDFFPLTVGSSWTYQTSNRSVFLDTTFVDTIQYTNLEETDFAGYPSVARETRSLFPSTSYYTVIGDSLYLWEYDHWSTVFPESSLPNRQSGDTLDYSRNNIFATLWTLERTDSTVVLSIGTFHYCFYVKFQRFRPPLKDPLFSIECLIKPGVGTLVKRSILFGSTPADTQSVTTNTLIDYVILP